MQQYLCQLSVGMLFGMDKDKAEERERGDIILQPVYRYAGDLSTFTFHPDTNDG